MSDRAAIAITGIGIVSPAGRGVEDSWEGVSSGRPAAAHDPELEEAGLEVTISCRVPEFDAAEELGRSAARRQDRFVHLASLAAREAIARADHKFDDSDLADRVGVALGCGIGGVSSWEEQHESFVKQDRVSPRMIPKMLSNMAAGQIAIDHGLRGPNMTVNTACAAGASAIHLARDFLRSGSADVMLAGGVEAAITPLSTAGFAQMGALSGRNDETASRPFDVDRDGFVMGEAAGVLVLERLEDARARGAQPLAILVGAGSSADAHDPVQPPEEGSGAALAMRRALEDAGLSPDDIDHINAHGTSTPLNDVAEARAIRNVFGSAADQIAVTSTKGVTGHTLGAAGAVESIFVVLSIHHGMAPPTANLEQQDSEIDLDVVHGEARKLDIQAALCNAFGFGGQNGCLIFTAGE